MNLSYHILWIDDDLNAIEGSKEEIEQYIETQGYEPNIKLITPMNDSVLDMAIKDKKWNLIIVDYNLTETLDGKQLIQKIRDLGLISSIVFYSADPIKVDKEIKNSSLEGVYWASRGDELELTIQKVIDYTLKIVMNVNSMRGLVLAEVAEMDHDMEDIIRIYYNRAENHDKVALIQNILEKIKSSAESRNNTIKKACQTSSIDSCLDWRIIDSDKRRRTTKNILANCGVNGEELSIFNGCEFILKRRNLLAHGRTILKDGQEIIQSSNDEFNLEEAINLRNELRKQRKNFIELKEKAKTIN